MSVKRYKWDDDTGNCGYQPWLSTAQGEAPPNGSELVLANEYDLLLSRYRWLQGWYLRDGKRSEIDPHGHIRQTTPEIMDAAIDAALSTADGGKHEG